MFEQFAFWYWWVLAVVLLILEMFSPAAFFMWIGFAAGATGVFAWLMPVLTTTQQTLIFAVLSVAFLVIGKIWFKKKPIESDHPTLNRRGEDLIGQVFTVEQAIADGSGRVRVGDSSWKAVGADVKKGAQVRVVSVDSNILSVEQVD